MNTNKKDVVISQIEDMLSKMDGKRVEAFGVYVDNGHDFIKLLKNILDVLKGN